MRDILVRVGSACHTELITTNPQIYIKNIIKIILSFVLPIDIT